MLCALPWDARSGNLGAKGLTRSSRVPSEAGVRQDGVARWRGSNEESVGVWRGKEGVGLRLSARSIRCLPKSALEKLRPLNQCTYFVKDPQVAHDAVAHNATRHDGRRCRCRCGKDAVMEAVSVCSGRARSWRSVETPEWSPPRTKPKTC